MKLDPEGANRNTRKVKAWLIQNHKCVMYHLVLILSSLVPRPFHAFQCMRQNR